MFYFLKCGAKLIGYFEICNIFAKKNICMDKILGIGNALTDVSVILRNDDILAELGLPKGGMVHIDDELFGKIQQLLIRLQVMLQFYMEAFQTFHVIMF